MVKMHSSRMSKEKCACKVDVSPVSLAVVIILARSLLRHCVSGRDSA